MKKLMVLVAMIAVLIGCSKQKYTYIMDGNEGDYVVAKGGELIWEGCCRSHRMSRDTLALEYELDELILHAGSKSIRASDTKTTDLYWCVVLHMPWEVLEW